MKDLIFFFKQMIQYDRNTTKLVMRKRDGNVKQEQLPSEEICETKEKWEQVKFFLKSLRT